MMRKHHVHHIGLHVLMGRRHHRFLHIDDLMAPRRSARGVKPNPKYLNMVEFD